MIRAKLQIRGRDDSFIGKPMEVEFRDMVAMRKYIELHTALNSERIAIEVISVEEFYNVWERLMGYLGKWV